MKLPTRIIEQIEVKLGELHLALIYSNEHEHLECILTPHERILVNQERAHLYRVLDGKPPNFVQRPQVQNKIIRILYLIERTNWQPSINSKSIKSKVS